MAGPKSRSERLQFEATGIEKWKSQKIAVIAGSNKVSVMNSSTLFWLVVVSTALLNSCSEARIAPANSLRELHTQLYACMNVPSAMRGSEITIVFSINRDGSLVGKARIYQVGLSDQPSNENEFVAGAVSAFQKCLPLNVSKRLGDAMAGRPIILRIIPTHHPGIMNV